MSSVLSPIQSPALQSLPEQQVTQQRETDKLQASKVPEMRDFGDAATLRTRVYDSVLSAAGEMPPVENVRHALRLSNVAYADKDDFPIAKQKAAILEGRTLNRRIRGTWDLIDKSSGKIVDTKEATVAHVPYFTNRGTMIHNGNEYTLSNQMRLRSGIFTRIKDNGEIEAHANILPGKGVAHRYFLEPDKGVFKMKVGQANIPLFPLLKAMGATDKQLRDAWGNEIYQDNATKDDPAVLNKLYKKLVRTKEEPPEGRTKRLVDTITSMEMDPEINASTLGKPYTHLDLESILATTKKLVAVSRGEQEVDDRDHLAYQTILGPEDLFAERIRKDYGGAQRELLRKASFRGNLGHIQPGSLTKQLQTAILNSGLGQPLEEINPADIFDKQSKVSRLGEGGIPSIDAVPDEARSVQPSHAGFVDPVRTPESFRAGVDVQMSNRARKGSDGRIYSPFIDPKTGEEVYRSPQDLEKLTIAFPGEMKRKTKRVGGMRNGKLGFFPRKEISLVMPSFEFAFSSLGSMVPMKSAVKAQRMAMASRMLTQALPLKGAQAPLVQAGVPGQNNVSFEDQYGEKMGAIKAQQGGTVLSTDVGGIKVRYNNGKTETVETYDNFPFNRKTFIHNTPVVRPGDTFDPGQLLARSNFTDEAGSTALGLNMRTAYLPFRGLNFEDAVVISESAAKRLSSEHMYQKGIDLTDDYKTSKKDFLALFASKYSKETLAKFDDNGVIQAGTVVEYDDPLILAAKKRELARNKIHKKRQATYQDATIKWDHHSQGVVTDVSRTKKGFAVTIKAYSPSEVGDKLSGRYGDKGIISSIVPDSQMPRGADDKPFEVLLNPLGVISRTNPAQIVEDVLGKIAEKTGKPYKIVDFEDIDDLVELAIDELKKNSMKALERVTDAESGRGIDNILTGNRFYMKLHHTAEGKGQGRGTGGYTMEDTPAKGGKTGSKRVSMLDLNALLSHGATEVIRDAGAVRGQSNQEYWMAFLQGHEPPPPKVPKVYEKFINQLRGAGINVVRTGTKTNIMAMTDKDIDTFAGDRVIESGETVRFEKGLEPVKGGLFDEKLTGGHEGNRWAAIKLHEPMPSPVMEEPIKRLLGLTGKRFEAVLSGEEELDKFGSGPQAIQNALSAINLDKEIEKQRGEIASGRKTRRDVAVRKLGYLKSAKKLGIHPKDWMLSKAPVLPPKFRPISVMSDRKIPLVTDANYLYKELIEANKNLATMSGEVDDIADERIATYNAFKAVTGLGDPVHPKLQEKKVKGLLKHVFGNSPKMGTVQRRLLASPVDIVGRAVISPNPDLDMDQVGLPENQAWEVYSPFISRRLRRRGMDMVDARRNIEQRSQLARDEMVNEMKVRPVIINRAPVLHRFGVMAFYPRLTKNETLEVSPLVVGGFNADFDGDAMQYHVPTDNHAVSEAIEKMLPSRNLLSPADFKSPIHKPSQEYVGGIYSATGERSERPARTFRRLSDAVASYRSGELNINDPIRILEG